MKINLLPVSYPYPPEFSLSRTGDTLTLRGESFDFSQLPDGATLPLEAINSEHFSGPVTRVDGVLQLSIHFPIGPDATEVACFPEPIYITGDGPVELPK
ncbi:hypothetical protein [Pseudomonas sp.]|uniref:hypothetical protein n=1 Tax=Pseudomonas sp. TaxID=306 RepID=UPI00257B0DB5|nr:hypothetical protein [Pseudomonas sp.]